MKNSITPLEDGLDVFIGSIKSVIKSADRHVNITLLHIAPPQIVGRQLPAFRIHFKSGSTYGQIFVARAANMDGDEYDERIVWSGMLDILGSGFQEELCRFVWKQILEYRQELAMADVHSL